MLTNSSIIMFLNYILTSAVQDNFPRHKYDSHLDKINSEMVTVSSVNRQKIEKNAPLYYDSRLDKRSTNYVNVSEEGFDYDYMYDSSELDEKNDTERVKRAASNSNIPPSTFIISGKQIDIKMYPWMVYINMIKKEKNHIVTSSCGGSLVNSKFVLTAAHCFNSSVPNLNNIHLILAEYDTRTHPRDCIKYPDGREQCVTNVEMFPNRVIIHKQFNPKLVKNDIALIELNGIAPISEFIRPILLPNFNIDRPSNNGMELIVVGWGYVYKNGESSPVTLETIVNLVSFDKCRSTTKVPRRKLCAIGTRGQDACRGDSGGPLMVYHRGQYFLAGIVSGKSYYNKNAECGSSVPTTYTNVYRYLEWIKLNMRS